MYSNTKGISSDNYVVIQGWMCNELNLKGNDLLVFALIYGFCQDGKSMYSGGRQYIADTFNISIRTVITTLQELVEQGLIVRHESNDFVHPDIYTVAGTKETLVGGEKISLGVVKNLHGGGEKFSPNNTSNKLIDNTDTSVSVAKPSVIAEHSDKTKRKPLISSSVSESLSNTESVSKPVSNTSNKHITSNTSITSNKGVVSPTKKKNLYEKCMDAIDAYTDNPDTKELLITYFKVRKEMDKPLYAPQWNSYINDLKKLVSMGQDEKEVIQQSINRGYKGFYEVKRYINYNNRNKFAEGSKGLKTVQADIKEDLNEVL